MSAPVRAMRRGTTILAALLLAACGGGGDGFVNPVPTPQPVTVSIAPTTATVTVGSTTSLAVSISGGSPTPTLASCSSSSAAIAAVSVSGVSCVVVGVSPGTATITATTSSAQTATATVTVSAPPAAVTDLTLSPPTLSLTVGQTGPLTATPVSPAGASVAVGFTSSNSGVASVSVAGVVTAVAPGTATITATAVGTGVGFTPATINRTAVVTVTPDPCTPLPVTLPVTRTGVVTSASCNISGDRLGVVYSLNLASAAALELIMTPTNFAPYLSVFPQGDPDFIFRSRTTSDPVSGIWHLPAGATEIRAGALNAGATGNFQLQVQQVSASVENCRSVVVGGSVVSNQALQAADCLFGGFQADEFLLYSRRPCAITMRRTTAAASLADPFIEVYGGSTLVSSDDDSGGGLDAFVSLTSCRTPANDVLLVRATSANMGDLGLYTFSVVFGAAAVQEATERAQAAGARQARIVKPARTPSTPPVVAGSEPGAWLRHLGIGVSSGGAHQRDAAQ